MKCLGFLLLLIVMNIFPLAVDLTVSYIHRSPQVDYYWNSQHPKVEGWPGIGQPINWDAVVKNWSGAAQNVEYQWFIDNQPAFSGSVLIQPYATATVSLPWSWNFNRHRIRIEVDPRSLIAEEEEGNNSLEVFSDAISVGFYVEQSVYDCFRLFQKDLQVHSNCWEDWAQRQVWMWNEMFAAAVYPETPGGVLDRIRLDKITVVPDGALPLAGGLPTNDPNMNDRTVDLQWGFPATLLSSNFYANHTTADTTNAFYYEGSLPHELGHARYLIDLYGFNVHDPGDASTVAIRKDGGLILGTAYLPWVSSDAVHYTPIQGLMNGTYTYVDRYSAKALNLIAGHRATQGNYNAPGNVGVFLNDLPTANSLSVRNTFGRPIPSARLRFYFATAKNGVWYGKYYDDIPDLDLVTNSSGQVLVGRCPFSADGRIVHSYNLSNSVAIVRADYGSSTAYAFLESIDFNLEYWRGNTTLGHETLSVDFLGLRGDQNGDNIADGADLGLLGGLLAGSSPAPMMGSRAADLNGDGQHDSRDMEILSRLVIPHPNIAADGLIMGTVINPSNSGNHNIETIRDGYLPAVGSTNSLLQYHTRTWPWTENEYYGYLFMENRHFDRVVFQEGKHFSDGGWFADGTLKVQVRQGGVWQDVPFTVMPQYPVGNTPAAFGPSFETYIFSLGGVSGDGVRIFGKGGGSNHFVSIGEIEVYTND